MLKTVKAIGFFTGETDESVDCSCPCHSLTIGGSKLALRRARLSLDGEFASLRITRSYGAQVTRRIAHDLVSDPSRIPLLTSSRHTGVAQGRGVPRDNFVLIGGTHNKVSVKTRRGVWLALGRTWRWREGPPAASKDPTSGTEGSSQILARNDQQLVVPRRTQWRIDPMVLFNGHHPGAPCVQLRLVRLTTLLLYSLRFFTCA